MIRPDRHTDLSASVVNIAALIVDIVSAKKRIGYDSLWELICSELGEKAAENYPYSLNFLYLVGKISYDKPTDSFIKNED